MSRRTNPMDIREIIYRLRAGESNAAIHRALDVDRRTVAMRQEKVIDCTNVFVDPRANLWNLNPFLDVQVTTKDIGKTFRVKGSLNFVDVDGNKHPEPIDEENVKFSLKNTATCKRARNNLKVAKKKQYAEKIKDRLLAYEEGFRWAFKTKDGTIIKDDLRPYKLPTKNWDAIIDEHLPSSIPEGSYSYKMSNVSYNTTAKSMQAKIEMWKDDHCVGYWLLVDVDEGEGDDQSETENDISVDQRVDIEELNTVLPFYVQEQQTWAWCWAAITVSTDKFYNPESSVTQTTFIPDYVEGDPSASDEAIFVREQKKVWPNGEMAVAPERPCTTEKKEWQIPSNIIRNLVFVSLYEGTQEGSLTFDELAKQVRRWRSVVLHMSDSSGGGHYVTVIGTYIDEKTSKNMVIVGDPWGGIYQKAFDSLSVFRWNGYTWTGSLLTLPVLIDLNTEE